MSPWSGRRPALADEYVDELHQVRQLIASIPTVEELAKRWGVSRSTVRNYLQGRVPKRLQRRDATDGV